MLKVHTMQVPDETKWFVDLLTREDVSSYLEIGCHRGGSLQNIALSLPIGARVVGVELPKPTDIYPTHANKDQLRQVVAELRATGRDVQIVWGDSKSIATIAAVRSLSPFDCVFIDGDHRMEGVTSDWINYGPMARMVAFHDIGYNPAVRGKIDGCHNQNVPVFWEGLRGGFRHEECKLGTAAGIGVLWRS